MGKHVAVHEGGSCLLDAVPGVCWTQRAIRLDLSSSRIRQFTLAALRVHGMENRAVVGGEQDGRDNAHTEAYLRSGEFWFHSPIDDILDK